jgi:hypothetical protein
MNIRKRAIDSLMLLDDRLQNVWAIHYSCESFYDRDSGSTPRITSIALRNLDSGQTESFSIHKMAEVDKIPMIEIANHYDQLEKKMLDEYYELLGSIRSFILIHWNMRDINYGFQAIEHRYRVLEGSTHVRLNEEQKYDLAHALIKIYGKKYAKHPRLQNIVKINAFSDKDFLSGKDEADAFDNGEFVKLHQSTLRKVEILSSIYDSVLNGKLKTNAPFKDRYSFHPQAIMEYITEHWVWLIVVVITTIFAVFK